MHKNDEAYHCRICGLIQDEPPWGEDGQCASFNICACCGAEFGYHDFALGNIKRHREKWLQKGGVWRYPEEKPADWS